MSTAGYKRAGFLQNNNMCWGGGEGRGKGKEHSRISEITLPGTHSRSQTVLRGKMLPLCMQGGPYRWGTAVSKDLSREQPSWDAGWGAQKSMACLGELVHWETANHMQEAANCWPGVHIWSTRCILFGLWVFFKNLNWNIWKSGELHFFKKWIYRYMASL